ncbi:acyltransferase [Nitratireductor mangrovi]|uniref:Acyltransferase n=1 Tax=Nitratireductor mangrovi TaxID=2599600 RepID=A0A5B8L2C3_9HYPH|nr:acyltransferase [Nitratireductor mangrovi]QDZ02154.1 acyltransferase [Nitratireductor mangrovi]
MQKPNTHYRIFETWRLVAALAIMMWHFLRFAPPGHEEASAALYRLMPLMEMFFMISGYLIMERYFDSLLSDAGSFRRYLIRRIARFYPLYLVTLAFFCVIALAIDAGIVSTGNPDRYDWSALPANLFLLQAWGLTDTLTFNYVAWSMSAEWFCYLLLPVIVLTFAWGGKPGLAALALLSIVALEVAVAAGVIPFDSWLEANTWGAYRAFADFALGAFVAMAARDSRWRLQSHLPAWLAFALAVAAMATRQDSYVIVALLGAAIFCAAVAERNRPEGSAYLAFLHPVGRVSLGIYLIHPVIESIFFAIIWRKLVEPTGMVSFYVFWLLPALVVIVVAILSDRYFERPVGKWITGRFAGGLAMRRPLAPAE